MVRSTFSSTRNKAAISLDSGAGIIVPQAAIASICSIKPMGNERVGKTVKSRRPQTKRSLEAAWVRTRFQRSSYVGRRDKKCRIGLKNPGQLAAGHRLIRGQSAAVGRIDKAAARAAATLQNPAWRLGRPRRAVPTTSPRRTPPGTPDDGSQAACFDPPCESETTSSPQRASVI